MSKYAFLRPVVVAAVSLAALLVLVACTGIQPVMPAGNTNNPQPMNPTETMAMGSADMESMMKMMAQMMQMMGADMDTDWAPNIDKPKNGFDVTLHTEDSAEGQRWFDQLSEGGKAIMPFGETFWSPGFGSLIDKFGVPWMVNVIPSPDWKPQQG